MPFQNYGAEVVDTRAHRFLSLSVAEQAITLLKNEPPAASLIVNNRSESKDGQKMAVSDSSSSSSDDGVAPLLPLDVSAFGGSLKLALVGPQANFTLEMLSNYEGQNILALNHSTLMAAQRR